MDAGLRKDGLTALGLWDVVIEVLRSSNSTKPPTNPAAGNCSRHHHSKPKQKGQNQGPKSQQERRKVDQLSNVDCVPSNTHSSQGESQLYIFEDNEAVIKIIIKRRSRTMRHVSRTHRVALDWLFDRIKLEPKLQIKYVDQKNNSLTCWPKWVSRVKSGTTFFVCSTLSISRCSLAAISAIFFLIRPGSRAPCQREGKKRLPVKVHQWRNDSQLFQRRRDRLIWCYTTRWVRGKTLCKIWAIPSIRWMSIKNEAVILAPGNRCGLTNAKIQSSILKWGRQGNSQHANSWKQGESDESSNSTSSGKPVRAVNTKTRFSEHGDLKPSTRDEGFPIIAHEVGSHNKLRNILQWKLWGPINVLIWDRSCLRHWKQPFILDQLIERIWKYTRTRTSMNFKYFIQYHTETDIGTFWRDSECEHDWTLPHDQVIQWTRQKYVSIQTLYCVWGRCRIMSSGRIQNVRFLERIAGNRRRSNWISSGIFQGFTSLQILQKIQNDVQERNIEPEKFTDRIICMSMFNDIDCTKKGNDEICISNSEIVKSYGKKFSQGHWTGDEKKRYGKAKYPPWRKVGFSSVSDGPAIQGNRSPSLHKCQCIELWNSENAERKRNHTLQSEPLFRIIHSVNQPSIYGGVSNWCEQFGLTEDEKGTRKNSRQRRIREESNTEESEFTRSELFGIFSKTGIWKQLAKKNIQDFESLSETVQFTTVCEDASFWYKVSAGVSYKTKPDEDDGFGQMFPLCGEYTLPRVKHMQQFLEKQLLDQSLNFTSSKFLTALDLKSQFHL